MALILVILNGVFIVSCANSGPVLTSKNSNNEERIKVLKQEIAVKSTIEWTEFELFDVNRNDRNVPGASNKDYQIIIKTYPDKIENWTKDKQNWITSFPHDYQWIYSILTEKEKTIVPKSGYITYYKEKNGGKYTLWVNKESGIILIRYIQE